MAYDNPIHATYRFPAAAIDTAGSIGTVVGPAGKTGRLLGISSVVTVQTTTNPSNITVGSDSDADAYGTHVVPAAAVGTTTNGLTRGVTQVIPADSDVEIASDGGAAAGDGDIIVHISWF